jgi:hypothetical protein
MVVEAVLVIVYLALHCLDCYWQHGWRIWLDSCIDRPEMHCFACQV